MPTLFLRRFVLACAIIAVALAALFFAASVWLATGPREIPALTPEIEAALNPRHGRFNFDVSKTVVGWGGLGSPLLITTVDTRLMHEGETFLRLPSVQVSLDFWSMLQGEIRPHRVTLYGPELHIAQNTKGRFFLRNDDETASMSFQTFFTGKKDPTQEELAADKGNTLFAHTLSELAILDAKVTFHRRKDDFRIALPGADFIIRRNGDDYRALVSLDTEEKDKKSSALTADIRFDPASHLLETVVNLKNLNPARFADINPQLEPLSHLQLPLSGEVRAQLSTPDYKLKQAAFNLTGANGKIVHPEYFSAPLTLQRVALMGSIAPEIQSITINKAHLDLGKPQIKLQGAVVNPLGTPGIHGQVTIQDIFSDALTVFWPMGVAPSTREWVVNNIQGGYVKHAKFVFDAEPGELAEYKIRNDAIQGEVLVEDAAVIYAPDLPNAWGVTGKVQIGGDSLRVDVDKARILNSTQLTGPATVMIPSFAAEEMNVEVQLPVAASASDTAEYLQKLNIALPEGVKLDAQSITGSVQGDVKLVVIVPSAEEAETRVNYNIGGTVENVAQPDLYKTLDVTEANGEVAVTENAMRFDGKLAVDKRPIALTLDSSSKGLMADVKGNVPIRLAEAFGMTVPDSLAGFVNLDGSVRMKGEAYAIKGNADLNGLSIMLPEYLLSKDAGEAGRVSFDGTYDKDILTLSRFDFTLPSGGAEGAMSFNTATKTLQMADLDSFTLAGSNFSGKYSAITGGHAFTGGGRILDLSFLDKKKDETESEAAQPATEDKGQSTDLPALKLDARFDEVVLGKNRVFNKVRLRADCSETLCNDALVLGETKEVPFLLRLVRKNNQRILVGYTPDAGRFLRSADLYENMRGGELTLQGVFQDDKEGNPLVGRLEISEHRIRKAPLLAKLLTIATFTGIGDALSGNGMTFTGLIAPFTKKGDVIRLSDAKTAGPSIGITATGSINLNKNTLNITGVVVPANMFNEMIASIPLIGEVYGALTGDGLVAANYSLRGDMDDPAVMVNPLSVLTPGFLRGFFDIFDREKNSKEQRETAQTLKDMGDIVNEIGNDFPEIRQWMNANGRKPESDSNSIQAKP
jgi:hypothetical protein